MMRRVAIRELSGDVIQGAAGRSESFLVTNGRVVCGIVHPIDQDNVDALIERNLARVAANVLMAESEVAAGVALESLDAVAGSWQEPASAGAAEAGPGSGEPSRIRRVALRDLRAGLLDAAAAEGARVVVTNNRVMCAIIEPIAPEAINRLLEAHLERLAHSAALAERDVALGTRLESLDEVVGLTAPA